MRKRHSEETKRKISIAHKGKKKPWAKNNKNLPKIPWNKGIKSWVKPWLGKKRPENSGVKNNRWKGGISIGENAKTYNRIKCTERWSRKRGAEGNHNLEEWKYLLKRFNNECLNCGSKDSLEQDHIRPLSKRGSNYIENIQPLCKKCNIKKFTKEINYIGDWLFREEILLQDLRFNPNDLQKNNIL